MSYEIEDVCPTATSARLLRLHLLETGWRGEFDPLHLIDWWVKKLDDPGEGDTLLSTKMWRQLARHIHALVAVNVPCVADAVAYDLGIESPLIPEPELVQTEDGKIAELWTLEAYGRSLPPFGFETWQKPLKVVAHHPCTEDFLDWEKNMETNTPLVSGTEPRKLTEHQELPEA